MAKKSTGTVNGGEILVDLSQDYIDSCINRHIIELQHLIRSDHAPPADGSIERIVNAIHLLRTVVIAKDDKAGRGSGEGDDLDG